MTAAAVHQFVSSFVPNDAVSRHTIEVRRLLRELGVDSEIYVQETRGEVRPLARFYRSYEPGPGPELLLYQAATGSPVAEFLVERPERKLVNYHNLTPPEFFAAWEPHTSVELEVGRRQMRDLAEHTELAVGVSRFNEADLVELGYRDTAVAPVLFDPSTLEREADPTTLGRLEDAKTGGGPDVLFVGRLVPNKAQHDLVKAFAARRRLHGAPGRLHLVGAAASPRYQRALRGLVAALELDDVVSVPGPVTDAQLAAHYRAADLFVCLSEHEGFCVPLLEAMHHRVPVVAYEAGAVPETLGRGGLLLPEKDPATVAEAIERCTSDAALRAALVAAGTRRLAQLDLGKARERFCRVIEPVLEAA